MYVERSGGSNPPRSAPERVSNPSTGGSANRTAERSAQDRNAMEGTAVNLKTYQAYSMAEALAAVKRDLGADAIILNTRTFKRGGLLGLGSRTIVELTASTNAEVNADAAAAEEPNPIVPNTSTGQRRRASRAYGAAAATASSAEPAAPGNAAPTRRDREKTRRLAQVMLEQHRRREQEQTASSTPMIPGAEAATHAEPEETPVPPITVPAPASSPAVAVPSVAIAPPPSAPEPPAPVARRFLLSDPAGTDADELSGGCVAVMEPPRVAAPSAASGSGDGDGGSDPEEDSTVRAELGAIRQLVCEVLQRQVPPGGTPTPTMPERLFDMYLKMIGQEVSEELADQVINDVRDELTAMQLEDEDAVRAAVRRSLADFIPTADDAVPGRPSDGRPLTIVLIGPTGVGKTTTLAKVAASFKLRHGCKVGLITADTYRIAAVDQLRTYANIIGLPLNVALTPNEMRQAVRSMSDQDVILIDTAGRSQNDDDRIRELKSFVDAADPHEVHLVLSSTAGEKVLVREAEAFGAVGVDKVVLTKLDEAVSFGVLVNVVRKIGKNLSFFTTGQEVPDQIEVSRPERLAELILGADVHA